MRSRDRNAGESILSRDRDQLDPETTRRPYVDSAPVLLADDRFWGLAVPRIWLRPHFVERPDELGTSSRFVEDVRVVEFADLVDNVILSLEDEAACSEAVKTLAFELLSRVHAVDSESALDLLAIPEKRLSEWTAEVLSIALGERCQETTILS